MDPKLLDLLFGAALEWIDGLANSSWTQPFKMLLKIKAPTITYACTQCGFLESYLNKIPE